jgi:hypothetical protein
MDAPIKLQKSIQVNVTPFSITNEIKPHNMLRNLGNA